MKKIISTIFFFALLILAIDAVCWFGWAMSGQAPVDGFYLGSITQHILQAIFY